MSKIVVANLKSYLNDFNVENYIESINDLNYDNLIICVPDKYIDLAKSNNYKLGLQDYSNNYNKAEYVLLGHYDRRKNNETDEEINKKVKKSLLSGLKVILCVGNEKEDNCEYIFKQIDMALKDIDTESLNNVIIAYEPFYMIGEDIDININIVKDYICYIKKYIEDNYHVQITILYGGNVNENNIDKTIEISDGVLIGRASFDVVKFKKIIEKLKKLEKKD